MTLADKKKEENIVEYLLFMWQMEEMARSLKFEPESINALLQSYEPSTLEEEKKWFLSLFRNMKSQKLETKGHLYEVDEVMVELVYLHQTLMNVVGDEKYIKVYEAAKPNIGEFLKKTSGDMKNDVDACMTALYGLLVLKIKGTQISPATQEAMDSFAKFLGALAKQYKDMKSGELNFNMN